MSAFTVNRSRLAEQQIVEHRAARVIDAHAISPSNTALDAQVLTDLLRQMLEVAERVPIP